MSDHPLERIPVCACDPGYGEPPSRVVQLECKLLGGPCARRHYRNYYTPRNDEDEVLFPKTVLLTKIHS